MPSPSFFLPLCICWLSAYVGGFNRVAILLDHLSSRPNSRRNFRCIWQLFNAGRSTPKQISAKPIVFRLFEEHFIPGLKPSRSPSPPKSARYLPSRAHHQLWPLWLLQPRLSPHHVRYVMSLMPSTRWGKMRSSYSGSKNAPALRLLKTF
jgi:hypothetical protein